jgi:hypothetical protein
MTEALVEWGDLKQPNSADVQVLRPELRRCRLEIVTTLSCSATASRRRSASATSWSCRRCRPIDVAQARHFRYHDRSVIKSRCLFFEHCSARKFRAGMLN